MEVVIMFTFFIIGIVIGFWFIPKSEKIKYIDKVEVKEIIRTIDFPLVGTTVYYIEEGKVKKDIIVEVNININETNIQYTILGSRKELKRVKKFENDYNGAFHSKWNEKYGLSYIQLGDGYYLDELLNKELPENFFYTSEEAVMWYNDKILEDFKNKLL